MCRIIYNTRLSSRFASLLLLGSSAHPPVRGRCVNGAVLDDALLLAGACCIAEEEGFLFFFERNASKERFADEMKATKPSTSCNETVLPICCAAQLAQSTSRRAYIDTNGIGNASTHTAGAQITSTLSRALTHSSSQKKRKKSLCLRRKKKERRRKKRGRILLTLCEIDCSGWLQQRMVAPPRK